MLKKLVFLLGLLYTVVLFTVCLIKVNNISGVGIPYSDKIFHFLSYMVFNYLWYYNFFNIFMLDKKKALIYAALLSIIFGIIIEVLQGTIATSRSAEVYDVVANTAGVLFSVSIIIIYNMITIKKR